MRDWVNLCQVLSWIAFRDQRLVTSDPDQLRQNMRRYRKRLIEPNPARDFLKIAQTSEITMRARMPNGTEVTGSFDWSKISEAELWKMVEAEWARIKAIQ